MTSKNNKQKKDFNIWNCIVKKIQTSYYYFKEIFGFESNRDTPPNDARCNSSTESVSTVTTPPPRQMKASAKREIANDETLTKRINTIPKSEPF